MSDIAYADWKRILEHEALPTALLDQAAIDKNIDLVLERLGSSKCTVRLASKSIRVPGVLKYLFERGGEHFRGLMTFSSRETAFLAAQGFDDFLLAYPIGRPDDAQQLAEVASSGKTVYCTIDAVEHVKLLSDAAVAAKTTLYACIDIDMSWRPFRSLHLGVRRSPIRDAGAAEAIGRAVKAAPGVELRAVLAYEAQVAGMRDVNPGSRYLDPFRQVIKRRSVPLAEQRRAAVFEALEGEGHPIEVVNGGGSGSIDTTARDTACTEVTVGSGFFCPHLFDGYTGLPFHPAVFFALSVVRSSDDDHVTCAGGGYIASGAPGADRLPVVHQPQGLVPVDLEGWGEVQTPFEVHGPKPAIGDPVLCRHAKSGELMERFEELVWVRDGAITKRTPTYRGLGQHFF